MKKKQTAVEWLVEQIKSDQNQKALSASEWMKVIEQAKEMERNNIEKAWHDGSMLGRNGWVLEDYSTGEGYYTKTYGNKQ